MFATDSIPIDRITIIIIQIGHLLLSTIAAAAAMKVILVLLLRLMMMEWRKAGGRGAQIENGVSRM